MTGIKRTAQAVLLASLATLTLSACAPLLIGSAATGVLLATDRRTSGAQVEDQAIELKAASRIKEAIGESKNKLYAAALLLQKNTKD